MGLLVNRFETLSRLKKGIETRTYDRVCLSAVLVHSVYDVELCNQVRSRFDSYAYFTGQRLLFVSFLAPKGNGGFSFQDSVFEPSEMALDSFLTDEIEKSIVPVLRDEFGIQGRGSYLVISSGVLGYEGIGGRNAIRPQSLIIKTSADSLGSQLDTLARISVFCRPYDLDGVLDEAYAQLSRFNRVERATYRRTPFDIIYDLFASTCTPVYREECELEQKRVAFAYIKSCWNRITGSVKIKYASLFANSPFFNPEVSVKFKSEQNVNKLDDDCRGWFSDFCKYDTMLNYTGPNEDYSLLLNPLCKIVEKELNLSVFQMIRQIYGIKMPDFYNKYCDEAGEVTIKTGENYELQINRKLGKSSPSLTLGDLRYAYLTVKKSHELPIKFTDDNEFIDWWKNFSLIRNVGSHSGKRIDKKDYEKGKGMFHKFMSDYLPILYDLKQSLSSPQN